MPNSSDAQAVINGWYDRISVVAVGHYRAALHYSRRHSLITVPTVILSAIVGTSVFATIQQQPGFWWQFCVGAMSVMAAIMTALQSTLRYQELAEKHRSAGAKYNTLGREIEELRAFSLTSEEKFADLRIRIDALAQESPHIPQAVHDHMNNRESLNQWGENPETKQTRNKY